MKQGIYINGKKVADINDNTIIEQVFSSKPGVVQVAGGRVINMVAGNMSAPITQLFVDGQMITITEQTPIMHIEVFGNVKKVKTFSAEISVTGNVGKADSTSGDISVTGDILGDADTTSGDIRCTVLHGRADTVSGDINVR
ncbi:hypothetical protein A1D23_08430 [Chelonobacter oris]|uniref:heme utilization protein n=1 Tax=Chelonobacter oris TaxID=505317 RepID=UPI00244BB1D3|nr:heme utilization protein [Chelonobacter oris]MDH3000206.1 hypothetical protein [Chelonobacter oris]